MICTRVLNRMMLIVGTTWRSMLLVIDPGPFRAKAARMETLPCLRARASTSQSKRMSAEIFEKRPVEKRFFVVAAKRGKIIELGSIEMQIFQIFDRGGQPGRNRKSAAKRILPKKQMKYRIQILLIGFPIAVGHGQLIQIGQQSQRWFIKLGERIHDFLAIPAALLVSRAPTEGWSWHT